MHKILCLLCLLASIPACQATLIEESTVLICGVCKDIEQSVPNTVKNIEALGAKVKDFRVIIYENNSSDNTVGLLNAWAERNSKVQIHSECLNESELPRARTERIARARNKILGFAKEEAFQNFEYLIMVDLDFQKDWPLEAIVEVIQSPVEWDCVSANSLLPNGYYWDRYAFRDKEFPFGPENLGSNWWGDVEVTWFRVEGDAWKPAYSAFGGLAIYKRDVVTQFEYSGTVTKDLRKFYRNILMNIELSNFQLVKYLNLIGKKHFMFREQIPIKFQTNTPWNQPKKYPKVTCCEHLPLHASMAVHGYDKFYIHPKMFMYYYND